MGAPAPDRVGIRDENKEAAPRPRHCGVLNRTHTRASSLAKMSAGIPNPCGYIDQPARARLDRIMTAGPSRPVAGQRNNHYGCPTIKSQAPEPSSQSQSARRRWRPKSRRCDAGDGGGGAADATLAMAAEEPPMRRRRWRPRSRRCDAGDGGLRAGDVKFRATCSSSEREMWRVDEI